MLSSLERRRRLYAAFFALGSLLWIYYLCAAINWPRVAGIDASTQAARARIDRAEELLIHAPGVERRLAELAAELRDGNIGHIAPSDAYIAWVNQRVQAAARRVGFQPHEVEISTISREESPWADDPMLHEVLEVLPVRVNVTASPAKIAALVAQMETADPLATLASMVETPTLQDETLLKAGIVWEWPKWKDTPDAAQVRALVTARN